MTTFSTALPRKNTPKEPGLSYARRSHKGTTWTLIVAIQGEAPYLSWVAWEIGGNIEAGSGVPEFYFHDARIFVPTIQE
jgi:hypothetical protein